MGIPNDWLQPQPETIIGRITDIRAEESEFGRRIVVEIRPVNESTPRYLFFAGDRPTSPRTKWQRWLSSLEAVGIPRDLDKIIGSFVRLECLTSYVTIGGEQRRIDFWRAVKTYPDEEAALAEALAESGEEATAEDPTSLEIPDADRQAVKALWKAFEGMPDREQQFREIAAKQYPNYDVDQLVAIAKS